jgi:ATP-dependent Lhr-like helicase
LLALSEGSASGKFNPDASETEWCDRRLLARIHRLTIHRPRAEIEAAAPTSRFLLAWQREPEHRVEGPEGVKAVLDLLDGYQLPAAAWEPEVLALRVKNYSPAWLDQLCFTGRIGWSRLTPPQTVNGRLATPVCSSPISIYTRENLPHWLALSAESLPAEFSPDANQVLES